MSNPEHPQPPAVEAKTLAERTETAHRQLEKLRKQMQWSSRFTAFAGVTMLALLIGYFTFGYIQLSVLVTPEALVGVAGDMLDDNLPQARRMIEDEIEKSAPAWAEELSRQAIAAAPTIRQSLVDYSLKGTQASVSEMSTISEAEFRKMLQDNRQELERAFAELAKDENSAEVSKMIEEMLEKSLSRSLDAEAQNLLQVLMGLNERLQRAKAGEDLNEIEALERRVVMILRRMELEYSDPELLRKFVPEALGEAKSTP